MSLMQFNNLSLLTYGAIGLTGVILAIATVYDGNAESGGEEEAAAASVSSSEPAAPAPVVAEPATGIFGNDNTETQTGGKKKHRKTKRKRGGSKSEKYSGYKSSGTEKKARKTRHKK